VQTGDRKTVDGTMSSMKCWRWAGPLAFSCLGLTTRKSGMAAAMELATQMAGAFSSMRQDLDRGRSTEIDSLNAIYFPPGCGAGHSGRVNHALFTLVKLAEQKRGI